MRTALFLGFLLTSCSTEYCHDEMYDLNRTNSYSLACPVGAHGSLTGHYFFCTCYEYLGPSSTTDSGVKNADTLGHVDSD